MSHQRSYHDTSACPIPKCARRPNAGLYPDPMNELRTSRVRPRADAGIHEAHARRANPHTAPHPDRAARPSAARTAALAAGTLLALAAAGCDGGAASAVAGTSSIDQQIRDLQAALRPPEPGEHQSDVGDWNVRREALLERMKQGSPELGRAALEKLLADVDLDFPIQRGLLTVAAHAATEDTLPYLEQFFTTYGERIDMRAEACNLLAEVAPQRAIDLIEPVLRQPRPSATWPPSERMLGSYVVACERAEHDPVPLLAQIATDIYYDDDVRHRATKTLGDYKHPLARAALETTMIESSGNAYLRRLAAQSLLRIDRERCCAVITDAITREADSGFVLFLEDMIAKNCR